MPSQSYSACVLEAAARQVIEAADRYFAALDAGDTAEDTELYGAIGALKLVLDPNPRGAK